jgi:4-diphosphocytidyl-2-C-methyl-D-erythritol kinase
MVLHSYAKLNLYLAITGLLPDSYHSLDTLFERISLHDTIGLSLRQDGRIRLFCDDAAVPSDAANLAYRSAQLLKEYSSTTQGVTIRLTKRIPVGAGLGGGSSNAAAVLSGLNHLWRLNFSLRKLVGIARNIGSDVPFFLYDTSFARGAERGDKIRIIPSLKRVCLWHILVIPYIHVSTPRIYEEWDARKEQKGLNTELTRAKGGVKILPLALRRRNFSLLGNALYNDLERITVKLHPEVRRIKDALLRAGVNACLMSGSGPAVFGILPSRKAAFTVVERLKKARVRWRVFVTRTI